MEALKLLRLRVKEHLDALNREFKNKAQWEILDYLVENEKLKLLISIMKDGKKAHKIFYVWRCDSYSYYLQKEESAKPHLVVLESLFIEIAIDMYGGQVPGTSLMSEDWSEKAFRHLNVVPIT